MPKQASARTPAFYKAKEEAKRNLNQTMKNLKCYHLDEGLEFLLAAAENLMPYASTQAGAPRKGGQGKVPGWDQACAQAVQKTEMATLELDYSQTDNGYR